MTAQPAKKWRDSGRTQWGQMVLDSVDHLDGVNNLGLLARLRKQLEVNRDHIDQIVSDVLTNDFGANSAGDLPPDLTEIVRAMSASPALMATLNDPDVRALVTEPGNAAALAGMQKSVAAVSRLAHANTPLTMPSRAA